MHPFLAPHFHVRWSTLVPEAVEPDIRHALNLAKANLDKIIEKARAKNIAVLLCGMLAPPTMGADYQRDYMGAFPDLAARHKVAYLPFLLENIAMKKELNQADSIHPNAEGTKIMMENVYQKLKPMLKN